jgi:low affinity Fe/Cu permease
MRSMQSNLPVEDGTTTDGRPWFSRFANRIALWSAKPGAFLLALVVVVVWAMTGPIFNYSNTWQLVITTGATIVTFLMVFVIQNTQNRETLALQIKLSELILAVDGARNKIASAEAADEETLKKIKTKIHRKANA